MVNESIPFFDMDTFVATCEDFVAQLNAYLDSVSSNAVQIDNVDSSNSTPQQSMISCGINVSNNHSLPFGYMAPGLRPSRVEADSLRHKETQNFLSKKKLILVLDLDHTLLNSTVLSDLTPEEEYLSDGPRNQASAFWGLVQFRPMVREFLEEVSTMFEMYVYTLSHRAYAKKMVQLLDPDNKYFKSRVIARQDSLERKQKHLDLVLGQERAIIILDDRKDVWPMHNSNLIEVHRYDYFASSQQGSTKTKSFAETKCDENEYIMGSYLNVLKRIHSQFFANDGGVEVSLSDRDVRDVMKKVRLEIMEGCEIFLTHFSPDMKKELAEMAETMGAMVATRLDSSATHLVALAENVGIEEVEWANKTSKYLVDQRWIRDCYKLWRRIPEKSYI